MTEKRNYIKKELYRQKPTAVYERTEAGYVFYSCELNGEYVQFIIPSKESMGFDMKIPAQLLIRWLFIEQRDTTI